MADGIFWGAMAAGVAVSLLLAISNLSSVPQGAGAYTFISLLLWYPVIEELTFRGVLQGVLVDHSAGRRTRLGISVANLMATLGFVGWHLLYQQSLLLIVLAFPSLVFGFFRDRYQSVLPAILLHSFYNGCFLLAHWLYS